MKHTKQAFMRTMLAPWEMLAATSLSTAYVGPYSGVVSTEKFELKTKIRCEYCFGLTLDDERGNCMSCGGPRLEEK